MSTTGGSTVYIVYKIYTDPITSQVICHLWDPGGSTVYIVHTNPITSHGICGTPHSISLVSLAEQAWLTPAQLISVVILTRTWMLCRRIEDGSHSMNQGVQGKCITNTVTA